MKIHTYVNWSNPRHGFSPYYDVKRQIRDSAKKGHNNQKASTISIFSTKQSRFNKYHIYRTLEKKTNACKLIFIVAFEAKVVHSCSFIEFFSQVWFSKLLQPKIVNLF